MTVSLLSRKPVPPSRGLKPDVIAQRPADAALLPFHWPSPPFYQLVPKPIKGHGRVATVEMLDGKRQTGELMTADGGDSLQLRVAGAAELQAIDLKRVRTIRLKQPLDLVPDDAALKVVGGTVAHIPTGKTFSLSFSDGKKFSGQTRGFLGSPLGLFLFLPDDGTARTICHFVPRNQSHDVQIGPPLGETLQRQGQVDGHVLFDALKAQAHQRHEMLGEYLTRRAIITPDQLETALKVQKMRPHLRLGELLLETSLVTPEQIAQALTIQTANRGRRLGEILVSMGVVSLRTIQRALSEKLGIPYVNVREFNIDPTALDLVSATFAVQHKLIPLLRTADSLVVAVDNPLSIDFEPELRFTANLAIVPVIADPDEIMTRIALEYGSINAAPVEQLRNAAANHVLTDVRVEDLASQLARETPQAPLARKDEEELHVTDNVLVKLVNKIILDAHAQGASDIHIECGHGTSTRIRFRKDGDLEKYLELPPTYRNALVSRIKIMANLDIAEHRHAQDGKIRFGRFGPLAIELRVAVVPTTEGSEDVVLRILGGVEPRALNQLELCDHDLMQLTQLVSRSYGLILVCGPTGSGKTTTLHSVLHHINRPDLKIWTAEDPVEITQPGLRQVQLNAKIGWTFAAAMRAFLRADPDVIMVGEMRDAETTKIGIEASLTGHLVFSTLHTNSAAESIVRLLDMGMDPFNFADALLGVLSQRLARRLCPKCKKSHVASADELSALAHEFCHGTRLNPAVIVNQWRKDFGRDGQVALFEPVGCPACDKGHHGRVGIYELLVATPELQHLIRSHGTVPQLVEAATAGGMQLLKQDALTKVLRGELDLVSARAAAY